MLLEAVIVCVGYSDFLCHTLPLNKHNFDKIVVVTSTSDVETKKVCEYHHVTCVETDVFYDEGASFAKAKGINVGLEHLSKEGWVLHIDADIVLPPQFRRTLEPLELDESCIYGVDRLMCTSYEDWSENMMRPFLTQENEIFIHLNHPNMTVGTRVAKYGSETGFIPIGFFQLWDPKVSGVSSYPDEHGDAGRTDMSFSLLWPRRKRGLIPEIVVVHLESEKLTVMGKNWQGRKTRIFGPTTVTDEPVQKKTEVDWNPYSVADVTPTDDITPITTRVSKTIGLMDASSDNVFVDHLEVAKSAPAPVVVVPIKKVKGSMVKKVTARTVLAIKTTATYLIKLFHLSGIFNIN